MRVIKSITLTNTNNSPIFNKRESEARTGDPEPPININEDLTVLHDVWNITERLGLSTQTNPFALQRSYCCDCIGQTTSGIQHLSTRA